jgi:hypothetical protein
VNGTYLLRYLSAIILIFNRLQVMAQEEPPAHRAYQTVLLNQHPFMLEVARTPEQLQHGLMGRAKLADQGGMLFNFSPQRQVRQFWMKDCLIALDMLFIDRAKVVRILQNVPPCRQEPCPVYSSVQPVQQVIELKAGMVRQFKIKRGQHITL